MSYFSYKSGELFCEEVPITEISKKYGTPIYIYSINSFKDNYLKLKNAFDFCKTLICFAVKSNANLTILNSLRKLGCGADAVSGGEIYIAQKAEIRNNKIVFNGNGKTYEELKQAIKDDILLINVDNLQELKLIDKITNNLKKKVNIAFRINPNIDAKTHPHISTGLKKNKFGIDVTKVIEYYQIASKMKYIKPNGIHIHIGSQITELNPLISAMKEVQKTIKKLDAKKIKIKYVNLGGGIGIRYSNEKTINIDYYAKNIKKLIDMKNRTLILEPGRSMSGNSGITVSKVLYVKERDKKKFVVIDAAMNDVPRPALYDSYHNVLAVLGQHVYSEKVDIVGPICESTDYIAKNRLLSKLHPNDLLAIMSTGAYCDTMSSNYNGRRKLPVVVVDKNKYYLARKRQSYSDLIKGEKIIEL